MVLRRLPVGPADQALEGELRAGPLPQLPQLRVGLALPPRSRGGSVALGVGVVVGAGVGVRRGVVGPSGGGGPGGVRLLVVVRRGGARGVGVAWAYADTWTPTLPRGWGGACGCGGSGVFAGHGRTSGAGMGVGAPLAALGVAPARAGGGWLVGPGCRFWVVWG